MKKQYFEEIIKEFEKQIRFYDEEIKIYNDDKLRENRAYYQGCLDMVERIATIKTDTKFTERAKNARNLESAFWRNDPETAKLRSKTPKGVAKAMTEQWGD